MAGAEEYIAAAGISLIGMIVFWYGFTRMGRYRLIQDTPRSKIASMAMGLVEVHGTVVAAKHITAPYSGKNILIRQPA